MPRVVIELQANTQEAVQQIQRFAKAQKDAFDAVKAGNPDLAEATVRVSKLSEATKGSTTAMEGFQQVLGGLPGPLGAAASQVSTLVASLGAGPLGLATAAAAAMGSLALLATSFANDIERLDNLAEATGLSVQALQAFEAQAKASGEAPEALARGFAKINDAIAGVITGAPGATKAFDAIGVNLKALVKDGATTEEILEKVARAVMGITDPMEKAALMAELFGSKSRAMQVVMKDVAELGMQGLIDKWKELGAVTEEEANKNARAVDAMADQMSARFESMMNDLKAFAVKAFVEIGSQVQFVLDIMEKGLLHGGLEYAFEQLQKRQEAAAAAADEKVVPAVRKVKEETEKVATATDQAAQAADRFAQALSSAISAAIPEVEKLGEKFKDVANALKLAAFTEGIQKTIKALGTALDGGTITLEQYNKTVEALNAKLAEATTNGFPPATEATTKHAETTTKLTTAATGATTAVEGLGTAMKGTVAAEEQAINTGNALVDMYLRLARAALAAEAGANRAANAARGGGDRPTGGGTIGGGTPGGTPGGGGTTSGGAGITWRDVGALDLYTRSLDVAADRAADLSSTIRNTQWDFNPKPGYSYSDGQQRPTMPPEWYTTPGGMGGATATLDISGAGRSRTGWRLTGSPGGGLAVAGFQYGGIVPGSGPVPIIAHGGELIVPAHQRRAARPGGVMVRIEPGAVQVAGTVIDQQRGWGALVEELGQALESRLSRRSR